MITTVVYMLYFFEKVLRNFKKKDRKVLNFMILKILQMLLNVIIYYFDQNNETNIKYDTFFSNKLK